MKRALIMAGGTGGHVFPGLAVAEELRKCDVDIHWFGTKAGLESKLVPQADIPISYLSISGVRGKSLRHLFIAPFLILKALVQAITIIRKLKPDVVIGMGGFVSGPGALAAWLLRIPLYIHEQNAVAGTTNRISRHFATEVFEAFPKSFTKTDRALTIGNPIRDELINLPKPEQRFKPRVGKLNLLVLGGSRGALRINKLIPQLLQTIKDTPIDVLHQAGEAHRESTIELYQQANLSGDVVAFIDDMAKALSWADLVICRSGALTVSELMAVGVGSILIPFPYATDDHQTMNAKYLANAGAAIIVPQSQLDIEQLGKQLSELAGHRDRLLQMAQSAYQLRKIEAASVLVEHLLRK